MPSFHPEELFSNPAYYYVCKGPSNFKASSILLSLRLIYRDPVLTSILALACMCNEASIRPVLCHMDTNRYGRNMQIRTCRIPLNGFLGDFVRMLTRADSGPQPALSSWQPMGCALR